MTSSLRTFYAHSMTHRKSKSLTSASQNSFSPWPSEQVRSDQGMSIHCRFSLLGKPEFSQWNRSMYNTSSTVISSQSMVDLTPRDDIEALALTALFLLRGNLPWIPRPRLEDLLRSQEIVRLMKLGCSGSALCTGFLDEFGELLNYSRSLKFDQFSAVHL